MTRKTDRLEVLARDLASRYGEGDTVVQSVRAAIVTPASPVVAAPHSGERRRHAQGPLARRKQGALHVA
jgi:hypothetical protein